MSTEVCGHLNYDFAMLNPILKLCLALGVIISIAVPAVFAKRNGRQPILDWVPASAQGLVVVNSPFTYYWGNEQPIDPESMFECMMLGRILQPPSIGEESRWLETKDIVQCAFVDSAAGVSDECFVAVLRQDKRRDQRMFSLMRKCSVETIQFENVEIHKFFEDCTCDDDKSSDVHFKAMPAPNVLICASNIDSIKNIVRNQIENLTLDQSNLVWRNISKTASYWGFRTLCQTEREKIGEFDAVGYNFTYEKKTLDFKLEYLSNGTYENSPCLKRFLESGATDFKKIQKSASTPNIYCWRYAATWPKQWSGPINEKVWIASTGFSTAYSYFQDDEGQERRKLTRQNR